jgi:energy-coupling factor transporter ATP-binding protein EcfA2
MIEIEGLSFRFGGSLRHALRDVNLSVDAGEFLVVTGPSGCGKSTLALAIGGYLFRQYEGQAEGMIAVAGMDVQQQPIYDVAEVVGLVQQNPEAQFCTLTVQDEIAFGLENRCLHRDEIRERMAWALGIVGAEHLADRSLSTLSGGEKQKVAIAAMMATRPQVLIFDEPTSNLDPSATAEIFRVIGQIRAQAGITVLVIEHKIAYLRPFQPRLVVMDDGQISHDGPMAAIVSDLYDAWRKPTQVPGPPHARRPKRPEEAPDRSLPSVRVQDLYAGHNGTPVLKGVSVEMSPGEFVAVMGDNGSGKTTFLQSLLGLLKPSQGRVDVLGHDTRRTSVSQLAREVGFVFQNPDHQLFADKVWDEAAFAPRNFGTLDGATQSHIEALLERCGLGERHADHPYKLSYGQKRRLNLVSVLAYRPRLILLDELLIGQDPANASLLMGLLEECTAQGAVVVMVNHAPEITWQHASRLLFFDGGRVVVDAPTEEAFRQLETLGWQAYQPGERVRL